MQKFIVIVLILGLGFFLYLLQTGQINNYDFNVNSLLNENRFSIKTQIEDNSKTKTSYIYATILGQEYNVFTFSGDSFTRVRVYDFPNQKYKIPLEAIDAVTGTWIGNRYVLYILEKENPDTRKKIFEIYKTEYPTDNTKKLEYFKIKTIEEPLIKKTLDDVQY
jgi:hypothetical protein